jgi:hypothetical protein
MFRIANMLRLSLLIRIRLLLRGLGVPCGGTLLTTAQCLLTCYVYGTRFQWWTSVYHSQCVLKKTKNLALYTKNNEVISNLLQFPFRIFLKHLEASWSILEAALEVA